MRVLITGREGQVARSLAERAALREDIELLTVARPQLDLADPASVISTIVKARPDLVVSAAAYTAVDRAEEEPELAHAINVTGAGAVAAAAAQVGAPIVHLSTDYVFSGDNPGIYRETEMSDPQTVYGRTKRDGEVSVAAVNPRHVILRTAWVYSPWGRNFVKTMLRFAETGKTVNVVADQRGNPTSALDVADGILQVASLILRGERSEHYGIFHLVGSGSTSWAGFASHVFAESRSMRGPWAKVEEISSQDYPTRARRPKNSRLSCEKIANIYGYHAPSWQESCRDVVERLVAKPHETGGNN